MLKFLPTMYALSAIFQVYNEQTALAEFTLSNCRMFNKDDCSIRVYGYVSMTCKFDW